MTVAGTAPDRYRLALAALVLGAVGMGASPVFVRLADVGPFASAFWRAFLALPFLWAWARFEDGGRPGGSYADGVGQEVGAGDDAVADP